ncbi:GTPase [Flagellimonas nanhaiensis]|uniref:GTPase n=1 Tax=Flagellimonas nanhaiensis TaxID=2292706 RepID=A0A371JNY5_9FLAO|nr:GTPase [Allomuricauda nanhaiensis]RDY58880.1 GTPase [Allomuricauda nanhaiensis]
MQRLVFVYNAESGIRNAILDSIHKAFSPSTYQCGLCSITHGLVGENQEWKKFREQGAYQMEFLHKDEFQKKYASKFGHKFIFPIILTEGKRGLEVLISDKELEEIKTSKNLISLINKRMNQEEDEKNS